MSGSPLSHGARLASLAILRTNWDNGWTWMDSFVPFVAEALRLSSAKVVGEVEVQQALREQFGIEIPTGALRTILRRAAKRGLVIQENHRYVLVREALSNNDLSGQRRDALGQQAALVNKLCHFASERGHSYTRDQAERLLLDHVEQLALPLVRTVLTAAPYRSEEYILGAFIEWLRREDYEGFKYLETMVKGCMLAKALYVTDIGSTPMRFQRLVVYFDTRFLLNALGYSGKEFVQPTDELLGLVRDLGGQCAAFDHTVLEIQRVLAGIAGTLRSIARGNTGRSPSAGQHHSVEEHFISEGLGPADIEALATNLERHLRELGVSVRPAPPYQRPFDVDRDALERALMEKVRYHSHPAVLHDRDVLTAIWQLRRGQPQRKLETSRAIFVTTNASLVRAARSFFQTGADGWTWPLAILDHDLTTLVWLKRPFEAPDLPRAQIIADSFAAMRPNSQLWERYLYEIEELHRRGSVALNDFAALRYSPDARRALMDITLGDPGAMSTDIVKTVLAITRKPVDPPVVEPVREQDAAKPTGEDDPVATERIREVEGRLVATIAELHGLRDVIERLEGAQRAHARRRARRWATAAATAAYAILASLVVASTIASLPSALGLPLLSLPMALRWPARVVFVLSLVGITFAAAGTLTGLSVRTVARNLKRALTERLEERYLRQFDQGPVAARANGPRTGGSGPSTHEMRDA